MNILFENRKTSDVLDGALLFSEPIDEIKCDAPEKLLSSLAQVDALRQKGFYLAGYLSYEAGYVLQGLSHLLASSAFAFPLMHFLAFRAPKVLDPHEVMDFLGRSVCSVHDFRLNIEKAAYENAFEQIKQHLLMGNTYQVNFTAKYLFALQGSSKALYRALRERQKVAYSAYLEMGHGDILSLSPELFFAKSGTQMHLKPMKGTMPRDENIATDRANRDFLLNDEKSQAENLIVVDLLRNDVSNISKPGSVEVLKLLEVASYETVHQMTSSIQSEVALDLPFLDVVKALFPCGSITGAPKRRTMEIIHALESAPRDVYTGAIGYITPQNDMRFSVPIRTALCREGLGELGVGGGIVYDSVMQSEFDELQLKAAFFKGLV